jgi:hypothetical protein
MSWAAPPAVRREKQRHAAGPPRARTHPPRRRLINRADDGGAGHSIPSISQRPPSFATPRVCVHGRSALYAARSTSACCEQPARAAAHLRHGRRGRDFSLATRGERSRRGIGVAVRASPLLASRPHVRRLHISTPSSDVARAWLRSSAPVLRAPRIRPYVPDGADARDACKGRRASIRHDLCSSTRSSAIWLLRDCVITGHSLSDKCAELCHGYLESLHRDAR